MDSYSIFSIVLFTMALFISGLSHSVTGFGFGIVSIALLGLVMDIKEASILLAPLSFLLNLYLLYKLRHHVRLNGLIPLLITYLICVPFGGILLFSVNEKFLSALLGGLMIFAAIQRIMAGCRKKEIQKTWHPVAGGVPCGIAGGLLTGAFGTGGPPVVSFLLNRNLDRFTFVAATQLLFTLGNAIRAVQFLHRGNLEMNDLNLLLPGMCGMISGALFGLCLLRRMSETALTRVLAGFLIFTGLWFLYKAY
ncbi:MAG: sulfite exporter TauE/SafE family protein [Kiritimatiellales bacterium]